MASIFINKVNDPKIAENLVFFFFELILHLFRVALRGLIGAFTHVFFKSINDNILLQPIYTHVLYVLSFILNEVLNFAWRLCLCIFGLTWLATWLVNLVSNRVI